MASLSDKTDAQIDNWIRNHERKGVTNTPLYLRIPGEVGHRFRFEVGH